jgi:hypothetical protein
MKRKFKRQKYTFYMKGKNLNKGLDNLPSYEHQDEFLPIQRLENSGLKVGRNQDGKVIVGVGYSLKDFEGGSILNEKVYRTTDDVKNLKFHNIDETLISDYNSLWELTKSGWNSDTKGQLCGEGIIYPYISVDSKWYRWDNTWLRGVMKIRIWTKDNTLQFLELMTKNKTDILEPIGVISTSNEPSEYELSIDKNSCPCGSGLNFKKCCESNK